MTNTEIFIAAKDVPADALEPITSGKMQGKTSIKSIWRVEKLTELFGPCGIGWWYDIDRVWVEPISEFESIMHAEVKLYYKYNGEESRPIPGCGAAKFSRPSDYGGAYGNDDAVKSAVTDALSYCCKQLGIGAAVYYGNKDDTKYSDYTSLPAAVPQETVAAPVDTSAVTSEASVAGASTPMSGQLELFPEISAPEATPSPSPDPAPVIPDSPAMIPEPSTSTPPTLTTGSSAADLSSDNISKDEAANFVCAVGIYQNAPKRLGDILRDDPASINYYADGRKFRCYNDPTRKALQKACKVLLS